MEKDISRRKQTQTLDNIYGDPLGGLRRNLAKPLAHTLIMIDTFIELLASDSTWRSKVLKLIQYAARVLIVAHRDPAKSAFLRVVLGSVLPLARLKLLAQSISLSRRMLYAGETLVYARDAAKEVRGRRIVDTLTRPSALAALSYLLAGIGEDISIASKIGLVEPSSLPAFFPRYIEITWALQCLWYAYYAVIKLVAAQTSVHKAQRVLDSASTLPEKSSARALSEARVAVASAERDRFLALLNVLKCSADCMQSLPYALGWASFPEALEVQASACRC